MYTSRSPGSMNVGSTSVNRGHECGRPVFQPIVTRWRQNYKSADKVGRHARSERRRRSVRSQWTGDSILSLPQPNNQITSVIPAKGLLPLVCHSRPDLAPCLSFPQGICVCLSFPYGICISLSRRESVFVCHSRRESAFASFTSAMAERRKAHPEGWAFHK
jgi:hypothetical protein